jgi:hypothetical protein
VTQEPLVLKDLRDRKEIRAITESPDYKDRKA